MNVLILQIALLLLAAFLVGCMLGCWLRKLFVAEQVPMVTQSQEDAEQSGAEQPVAAASAIALPAEPESETPPVESAEADASPVAPETVASETQEPAARVPETHVPEAEPEPVAVASAPESGPDGPAGVIDIGASNDIPGTQPKGLQAPVQGPVDNLKKIKGIGPKLENLLNGFGIYHFDQIANWTDDEVLWVDSYLKFKGRIERDNWIGQARELAGESDTSR